MTIETPIPLQFKECSQHVALNHGDVVYVCKVYDGDTATVAWVDVNDKKVRASCRIKGIDTPELRGSSLFEKDLAKKAKKRLSDAILNTFVTILEPQSECFGRVLSDLANSSFVSVADYMLEDPQLCRPYHGKNKESWD